MEEFKIKEWLAEKRFNGVDSDKGRVYGGPLPVPFDDVPYYRDVEPRLSFILKRFDVAGLKVLDLGCNAGHYCFALQKRGAICTGVDMDKSAILLGARIRNFLGLDIILYAEDIAHFLHRKIYPNQYDLVLFLSTFQWVLSNRDLLDAEKILGSLSSNCKSMIFESAGSDSKAPLPQADEESWVAGLLERNGWKIMDRARFASEVGGDRWIFACSSNRS